MTDPKALPVRVKPLVWTEDDRAPSPCGEYGLRCGYDGDNLDPTIFWFTRSDYPYHDECDERYQSEEAAKAAAQADYEARIMSAIEVVEDDVLERAWMAGRDAAAKRALEWLSCAEENEIAFEKLNDLRRVWSGHSEAASWIAKSIRRLTAPHNIRVLISERKDR